MELSFWLCAGIALWYGASWLLVGALLGVSLALLAVVFVIPLRKVLVVPGTLSFTHPSKFYPGNP